MLWRRPVSGGGDATASRMASRDTHASAHQGVAHGVEGQAGTWGDFALEGVWSVRALGIRTPFPGRLTHVVERRLRVWSVDGIVPIMRPLVSYGQGVMMSKT